jgi:hypothetical protein
MGAGLEPLEEIDSLGQTTPLQRTGGQPGPGPSRVLPSRARLTIPLPFISSRPGRGATTSLYGYLFGPEERMHQSSSPPCLRPKLNPTLRIATRGIATTLAGASRS